MSHAFISGTPDSVTLGSAGSTVHYTAGQGVEVVSGFQIGTHLLDWALSGPNASDIAVSDVSYDDGAAVAITEGSDTTHGVILVNPGVTAATLVNDHLFTAGTHALIT